MPTPGFASSSTPSTTPPRDDALKVVGLLEHVGRLHDRPPGPDQASLVHRQFGTTRIDGVRVRLTGAYQADDGTAAQAVEIYIGGRFNEISPGTAKPGDDTEHEFKCAVAYYRRVVDGRTEAEIDMIAGRFIVDGIDRYAEIMAIIAN